jgi:asparagine synthetase B (glutamine-hydrolysing)
VTQPSPHDTPRHSRRRKPPRGPLLVLLVLPPAGSAWLAGAAVAAFTLPSVATGPLLGAWLDRRGDPASLIAAEHALSAAALAALSVWGGLDPVLTLCVAALAGAGVVATGHVLQVPSPIATSMGALLCFGLRLAAIRRGWRLPTFSVGLADSDDLTAARRLAAEVGTAHHERIYTEDELIDWVPEVVGVIESFDPQLVHSSVPNLLVAKLASRHVKVVLIGEGADELFAGYEHWGEIAEHEELHDELVATIAGLHAGGLHRVDRVAAACALEPRMPFLDFDVVELGLGLPAQWKLAGGGRPEKWLLRKAFEGWLPDELLWRRKAQFGQGTGARDVLRVHYEATVTPEELARDRAVVDPPLRTPEELAYYRLFQRHLRGLDPTGVVGRFAQA